MHSGDAKGEIKIVRLNRVSKHEGNCLHGRAALYSSANKHVHF